MNGAVDQIPLNRMPFPALIVNEAFFIGDCNPLAGKLLGMPMDKITGHTLDELFKPLEGSIDERYYQGKTCKVGTYRILNFPIGDRAIKIQLDSYPLETGDQLVVLTDVSDKVGLYELSRKAKRTAKIGSWELNLLTNEAFLSDETRRIIEVSKDYIPTMEDGITFYKEGKDRERIKEVLKKAIEEGIPYDEELIIITPSGKEKWVRTFGNVEYVNGKVVRLYGIFQDIDNHKRISVKNKKLTDTLWVALKSGNIGIWEKDVVTQEVTWDESTYRLFGCDPNETFDALEKWKEIAIEEDVERVRKTMYRAVEKDDGFKVEYRIKKGNSIHYIYTEGKVIRDASGNAIRLVGANIDVTRIKKAQIRQRRLLKITEEQNKSLLNFAHIVSHNLRSHASNMSTLTGLLLRDEICSEQQHKLLNMVKDTSENLDETIIQLNEVVKIKETHGKKMVMVKVISCFKDVMQSINGLVEESDVEVRYNIPDELLVYAVKPYLTSIFLNLLTNSIKYAKKDRKPVITIRSEVSAEHTVLFFKDNGVGIDLDRYGAKLFGMYKTFHGNKDAKGIGLFMTKNQMDAMDGKIDVVSQLDKGTEFKLIFKNKKIEDAV